MDVIFIGANAALQFLNMCIAGSVYDDAVFGTGRGNGASGVLASWALISFAVALAYLAVWTSYRRYAGAFVSLGFLYLAFNIILFGFACKAADLGDISSRFKRDSNVKALEAFSIIASLVAIATVGFQIFQLSPEFSPAFNIGGGGGSAGKTSPKPKEAVVPAAPEEA